jgi:hypothetical protein
MHSILRRAHDVQVPDAPLYPRHFSFLARHVKQPARERALPLLGVRPSLEGCWLLLASSAMASEDLQFRPKDSAPSMARRLPVRRFPSRHAKHIANDYGDSEIEREALILYVTSKDVRDASILTRSTPHPHPGLIWCKIVS